MVGISTRDRARSDGTVAYIARFRHEGRQTSETFDADRARTRFIRNAKVLGIARALEVLDATDTSDADVPTLAEQAARHATLLTGITEGTRRRYLKTAAALTGTTIGQLPVDAIRKDDVAAWVRTLETEGLAAKTIRNRHSLVSAALARAAEDGIITGNPARSVRIRRTRRKDMTILTPAEFTVLLGRVSEHYRPLIMFLYGAGARFGEATALRVSDLRLHEHPPTVTISRAWKSTGGAGHEEGPTKSLAGERTVSLPLPVADELARITAGKRPSEFVFVNARGGPVRHQAFWDLWDGWVDDEKVDKRTREPVRRTPALGKRPRIHDLRHSHASWMIGQGINPYDLKARLGHESIQTTMDTYGHLLPEAHVQAARAAATMFVPLPVIEAP